MIKKSLLLLIFLFIARPLVAAEYMVFWYPGEAGSTQEAQPILDTFMDYLKTKVPTLKLKARYFNTTNGGLAFINSKRPKLGIISYAAWVENKSKLPGAKVWLATNPLPSGQNKESYLLVGNQSSFNPSLPLYSSEPLTKNFIKNTLGFSQTDKMVPTPTSQILLKMKSIATGKAKGYVILTPTEGYTFKRMKSPWVKSLKVIATSRLIPSARVVLFTSPNANIEKLRKVLLNIKSDPKAQGILEELRLVGFSST